MKNSTLHILRSQQWKNRKNNGVVTSSVSKPSDESNVLIGLSQKEEDAQDAFLRRLGTLAYAHKTSDKSVLDDDPDNKYTSKWFFVLPEDYAESNKYNVGFEQLPEEPFNIEIVKKTDEYKDTIGNPVKSNIELVSEFILHDITPLLLGLDGGIEQAKTVIRNTIADIDTYPFVTLELLTREAVKLKLSSFITEYFNLPESEVQKLVEKILPPKQREVVVPVPMEGSRYEGLNARRQTSKKTEEG